MIQIDLLPDDVLLEVFHFYVNMSPWYGDMYGKPKVEAWQSLAHVCRRWRSVVFGSPRRLDLKLYCTPKTPAKDRLDVWPALPLIIEGNTVLSSSSIIAVLEQNVRVFHINLTVTDRELEEVLAPMQVPFPELTDLQLWSKSKPSNDETPLVIPDSFLGGSAPRLRVVYLSCISFPGLPKLLLSTTHLTQLHLYDIPHSGYISPQAIVAPLSMLSSLERLELRFQSPQSRPGWESQTMPPPKRSILPALYTFYFKGATEYIEELMTRIDTPQLKHIHITFFNQIDFDCPRLTQFINRTPTLGTSHEAHMRFGDGTANAILRFQKSKFYPGEIVICILCREPDWQLSSIEQVCNSPLHPLPTVEDLYIEHQYSQLVWKDDAIENTLWLQLLLPFTSVKNLYLFKEFAPGIADALQGYVGGNITEVLPNLQNISVKGLELSGSFQEKIAQFVAARRFSDHPIAISDWDGRF